MTPSPHTDSAARTRVLMVGPKTMCFEGIRAILQSADDVDIVGRAHACADGVERARALHPDVVVLFMVDCPSCATAATTDCVRAFDGVSVVVVGGPVAGPSILDAFEAGATAYVTVDNVDAAAVHDAVVAAGHGEAMLDQRTSSAVLARLRQRARGDSRSDTHDHSPTSREAEVLKLLVDGLSNQEIASRLHVSESTVKNHLHAIYTKLGVDSRSQAVAEAMRHQLV